MPGPAEPLGQPINWNTCHLSLRKTLGYFPPVSARQSRALFASSFCAMMVLTTCRYPAPPQPNRQYPQQGQNRAGAPSLATTLGPAQGADTGVFNPFGDTSPLGNQYDS